MPKQRSWDDLALKMSVSRNYSYRAVLIDLGLIPAGGNYEQIKKHAKRLKLDVSHFTGKGWNAGIRYHTKSRPQIEELLVLNGTAQSYKLKKRLYEHGIKKQECEICKWAEMSADGRIPLELDHINGDHNDNRLENLRILCPNCHSLQPTHRGKNKRVYLRARVLE